MIHRKITVYCDGKADQRHDARELCALLSHRDGAGREWWTADARAEHQPVDLSDYLTPDVLRRLAPVGSEPHTIDEQAAMLSGLTTRVMIGCPLCGLSVELGDWLGRGFTAARVALLDALDGQTPTLPAMPGHALLSKYSDTGVSCLSLSTLDRMLAMR